MRYRVSVIVPTYNRANHVAEAIDSVFAQSFHGFELIVVDDGSTDETPNILRTYGGDARFCSLRQENQGQAVARNAGLRRASGEFVCFLDSDNRWKPDKLERQVALMDVHPDVGVIYGDNELIDESGGSIGASNMKRYSGWVTRNLLVDNFVNFNASIVRKRLLDLVGGLDESVRVADDYDLWLRLSAHCEFLYVPELWAEYRVGGAQISADKERRFESNRRIIERFMLSNPQLVGPGLRRATWCRFYTRRARWRASAGRRLEATKDLLYAVAWHPFLVPPWRALARLAFRKS